MPFKLISPHTTDQHQILVPGPRKMTLSWCPTPATCTRFVPCHDFSIAIVIPKKNTQEHTSEVLYLRRPMMIEVSNALRLPRKMGAFSENLAEELCLSPKTIFGTLSNTRECHDVPRLPRNTAVEHILGTFENEGFASFPHRHVTSHKRPSKDEPGWKLKANVLRETVSHFQTLLDVFLPVFLTNPKWKLLFSDSRSPAN